MGQSLATFAGQHLRAKSKYDYEPVSSEAVTYHNTQCKTCKIVNNRYQHVLSCPKCPTTLACYDCEWSYGMVEHHDVDMESCIYYKKHNYCCCIKI
jgi:hypothetical protein